jgi:hypothetical protein
VDRPKGWSYNEDCEYLKSLALYEDNGYRYGSAWLLCELPESVEKRVIELIDILQKK